VAHYVLVTGGRDLAGGPAVAAMTDTIRVLHLVYGADLRIMHGAARGADEMAQTVADTLGVPTKAFPADWGRGRAAGIERNVKMGDLLADWQARGHTVEVLAFPGGRGTAHMKTYATKLGLTVTDIPTDGKEPE
jgi:hypothetical protein